MSHMNFRLINSEIHIQWPISMTDIWWWRWWWWWWYTSDITQNTVLH